MNVLAGGGSLGKILIFFVLIPLAAAISIYFFISEFIPWQLNLAVAIFVYFAVYALMSKFIMMA